MCPIILLSHVLNRLQPCVPYPVTNRATSGPHRSFKVIVDDLEVTLREAAAKVPEEPFEQATRPADVYTLGNHPAFRGIGGTGSGAGSVGDAGSEGYDEARAVEEAEAAAAAAINRNKREAIVVKVLRSFCWPYDT